MRPLTLTKLRDMDFGYLGVTTAGTARIDPVTNTMVVTGGVIRLGGTPQSARFAGATRSSAVVNIKIPNGTVLGRITATGKYGPYDPGATDGRQAAAAVAFNDNAIPADSAKVVTDAALVHCGVRVASLPIKTGPGSLDANARTALRSVVFYG